MRLEQHINSLARSGRSFLQRPRQLHEDSVHYFRMKNITLSADEDLIERARLIARGQRRTLNQAFREWLAQFSQSAGDAQGFNALMQRLQHVDAGRRFSRDELNER
ncbi:MAG: hypothetical protein ABR912_04290 [Terracidiphilus sp.]